MMKSNKKSFKKWINLRYDGKPYHKDNFPHVYARNYKRDILQNNFKVAYCADEDGEFYLGNLYKFLLTVINKFSS